VAGTSRARPRLLCLIRSVRCQCRHGGYCREPCQERSVDRRSDRPGSRAPRSGSACGQPAVVCPEGPTRPTARKPPWACAGGRWCQTTCGPTAARAARPSSKLSWSPRPVNVDGRRTRPKVTDVGTRLASRTAIRRSRERAGFAVDIPRESTGSKIGRDAAMLERLKTQLSRCGRGGNVLTHGATPRAAQFCDLSNHRPVEVERW
jgi:hypothetical protein